MVILKLFGMVLLIMFVISAIEGLAAFLVDVIRYPQPHEKVKIIPSKEMSEKMKIGDDSVFEENIDGLYLDKPKNSIFGGEINDKSID